jgi:hypothetical protein
MTSSTEAKVEEPELDQEDLKSLEVIKLLDAAAADDLVPEDVTFQQLVR